MQNWSNRIDAAATARIAMACLALSFVILTSNPLAAQGAQRPVTMDLTIGIGTGWGGEYFDRAAVHAELTLIPEHDAARVGAFTIGARATPASGDKCALDRTRTRCLDRFPALIHIGVLGGLEALTSAGTLRAMAGPAVYAGHGPPGVGALLHLDAAGGFTHLAVVAAARGGIVVRKSETLRIGSLEFGIRLR